jgi:hypothetical protein
MTPCKDCNGSGTVSLYRLKCIVRRQDGNKVELECEIDDSK